MPLGERFPVFYDKNDARFCDKSDLIVELWKYDMSGLKISSKKVHLGLGGSHSNLDEDEGLRRRPSGMEITKHRG